MGPSLWLEWRKVGTERRRNRMPTAAGIGIRWQWLEAMNLNPKPNLPCHNKNSSSNQTHHLHLPLKVHSFQRPRYQNLPKVQNLPDGSPIIQSSEENYQKGEIEERWLAGKREKMRKLWRRKRSGEQTGGWWIRVLILLWNLRLESWKKRKLGTN